MKKAKVRHTIAKAGTEKKETKTDWQTEEQTKSIE